ncbi:MAG TPA: DUF3025 domain-containing protein [Burkholderiaceae bacterium]|nr:DUF3025 domain-containing protein [Burkholderiaceae bacterium]
MAFGLEAIDWQAPWLSHLRGVGLQAAQEVSETKAVCEVLNGLRHPTTRQPAAVQFIAQNHQPNGMPYESCVFEHQQCPTRNNVHDFFNGLCWHHFPQTKARINQLHAEQIALCGSSTQRGTVRDALTLLDENGAFLIAPAPLWQALLVKDWQSLFITHRKLWQQSQLILFGHALMEKLVTPRKAITAHVYILNATNLIASQAINTPHTAIFDHYFSQTAPVQPNLQQIDALIANDLQADTMRQKPFAPLPILGVPQWCKDNEDPHYYADTQVFRQPAKTST